MRLPDEGEVELAEGEKSAPRVEVRLLDRWVMTADTAEVLDALDPSGGIGRRASRAATVSRATSSVSTASLGELLKRPFDALRNLGKRGE